MHILTSPETTEIIHGTENILNRALSPLYNIKEQLDGCFDHTGPAAQVTTENTWKAINDLAKRRMRMRYLTEIRKDNIDYCKEMMRVGIELRHIEGVRGNFGIADRSDYLTILVQEEGQGPTQALVSNVKSFVEQQQIFLTLFGKKQYRLSRELERLRKDLNQIL